MALRGVDVSLRYGASARTALHALTFTIAAGERCLVTGPNGAGKSSLLKLLAHLYEPTTGTLWADEVPLTEVPTAAHRQRLVAVLQDSALFEVSLRENLVLGQTTPPDDAALWRALSLVGMADAVRALPLGLDTPCSRRLAGGVEWSAGQARRLVLARAFATPVDLLLLDEPCAALDADGVTALVAALAALPRTTTVVVVEHHPAVRAVVDRVWTLVAGQLRAAANDRTPPPGELPH
jgi:ABC-type bacteriocin/lantibiotic exporter with double-glycine peptidase domain